jgi:hypothetical protein
VRTCPNCGASVAETDEFCGNCGTYLAWLKPEPEDTHPEPATTAQPAAAAPPAQATPEPPPAAAEQPHAVAPAKPVAQRRSRTPAPAVQPTKDGPRCAVCGTVNPHGAKFCRHCGSSLVAAAAPRPSSRWRRMRFPGPGGSPWPRRIVVLVVLIVLVVAGFLLYPYAVNLVQDVRDKLATPAPITPATTAASAAAGGHPVGLAVDGLTNTYWGAPAVGASARFTFAQPFRLLGVIITAGASTDQTAFNQQARPTAVDLVVTSSDGTSTTLPVTLADKPGPQTTNTGVSDVTGIRLVIRAATAQAPGQSVALAEIEFFKRP